MTRPHRLVHSAACHPRALEHCASTAAAASPTLAHLARRGAQRWSALVSAPGSRLAQQMRPHLGTELWDKLAIRHYKAGWLRAFAPKSGVLRCAGTLDGRRVHSLCAGRSKGGS